MAAPDGVSWRFFPRTSSFRWSFKRSRAIWVCAVRGQPAGEGTNSSASDNPQNAFSLRRDHYALLGIRPDASPLDIKLAFRQLARKYHPDVNNDSEAAETFKTIRLAYETLSDKTSRHSYDKSLKVQAQQMVKSYQNRSRYKRERGSYKQSRAPFGKTVDSKGFFDRNQVGTARRDRFTDRFHGKEEFAWENGSENRDSQRGPSLRQDWVESLKDVILMFCLVGFIWHILGAQVALIYFVFFIPHNIGHSPLYRFASVIAWLIGGRKGLALHYGIVMTGWLYGKSQDMVLALVLIAFWIEAHFPHAFQVPRGATLLMAHICLGGVLPH